MTGKPYKRPTKERLSALLSDRSIYDVATELQVHHTTVRAWGLHFGLIARKRPYDYGIPSGEKLRKLCLSNTDAELAERFKCSVGCIISHRHSSGIFRDRKRRRYSLDESFFEKIDTEEKAYALGFIAADGGIPDNGRSVRIELHAKDVHILRDIRRAMGSNARISEKRYAEYPNRGPYKLIYFSSQKLVADLARHGVTPRKSLTLQYPRLPRKHERHYLRGLFDGDGCIRAESFYFLGTEAMIDGVRASIFRHTGIHLTKAKADKLWTATGCKRSRQVLSWLYGDATIFLRRKHRRFVDHW